jgi:hypothetical protein
MEITDIVLSAGITIFSLGLLVVSLISYRKYQNKKLMFTTIAFLMFFIKGIVSSAVVFNVIVIPTQWLWLGFSGGLLDLLILLLLFIATLKR